jgi:hypothetical protein
MNRMSAGLGGRCSGPTWTGSGAGDPPVAAVPAQADVEARISINGKAAVLEPGFEGNTLADS